MSMVDLPGLQEMIDSISRERNLPKSAVQTALGEALLKGYERYRRTIRMDGTQFDEEYFDNFYVELDPEEEGFRVLANKTIVDGFENHAHFVALEEAEAKGQDLNEIVLPKKWLVDNPDHEIALQDVQEVAPEAQLNDTVVLDVTPEQQNFGRMAAIQTKQVLAQKLRDQQRRLIQEEFQDLEGTILQARVLRFERQSVIMSVNSGVGQPDVEAELLRKDQLPNDNYRANATFRVVLKKVSEGSHRGPQLLVSRTDAALVVELFSNEVPEIEDEVVRIVAVAREANPSSRSVGPRTKIAVDTLERDVDPVGACIGARGSRIQVVVNELRGEKIDVIRWSPDPATYIANALSPARVDEVRLMNPEERQAHVLVPEDQLSLAIGKEGQNVRLGARLTGWKIDIKDTAKYDYETEDRKVMEVLEAKQREIDEIEAAIAAYAAAHGGDPNEGLEPEEEKGPYGGEGYDDAVAAVDVADADAPLVEGQVDGAIAATERPEEHPTHLESSEAIPEVEAVDASPELTEAEQTESKVTADELAVTAALTEEE
ncbi:MAG: transcription termination factor NusA [Cyanobacteria bacterium J06648_16]